jgi:polygalacturonase
MRGWLALFWTILFLSGTTCQAAVHIQAPRGLGAEVLNSESFGARGDGLTDDTESLQRAIDATARQHGTLVLKPGTYVTGALFLKSHMVLRIDKGVHLIGRQTLDAYPRRPTRIAGVEMVWPAGLLNIYQQSDIRVTGEGIVDGDGKVFWDSYWQIRTAYTPRGLRWAADFDAERPRLFVVYQSKRIDIGNGRADHPLNLIRSGFWTLQITYSEDIHVAGVRVQNNIDGYGPSTDGIDIDSSHAVLVENAEIDTHDDAIVLKSGRDTDGLRVNRPTYDVVIRNSVIKGGVAGVAFGSETSGGIHDVEVYGLTVLAPTVNGILMKSAHTRGGEIYNINIHDLTIDGVETAIRIDLNWNPSYSYATLPNDLREVPPVWKVLATPVPAEQGLPHFHAIQIRNMSATRVGTAMMFDASAEAPAEDFTFEKVTIGATTAGSIQHVRRFRFLNTVIKTSDGSRMKIEAAEDVAGPP